MSGALPSLARLRCVWLVAGLQALEINRGADTADKSSGVCERRVSLEGRCSGSQAVGYGYRESSVETGWLETQGQRGKGRGGHTWGWLLHTLVFWAVCP